MVKQAAKLSDPKARTQLYDKAQKLMLEEESIMVPLYQQRISQLVSARVKKVHLNAENKLILKRWSL